MPINYYAIARQIGGKMVMGSRPGFGGFHQVGVRAEVERHCPREDQHVSLSLDDERKLVQAFEDMRKGRSTDCLLWDRSFAALFHRTARDHGVDAPAGILTRRLVNIRKCSSSPRYRQHGIVISPTTVRDPHPRICASYAHAVEFALVQLRYRYGASIDDILMEPALSEEYTKMATQIARGESGNDLRLGALYIRKSRYLKEKDRSLFDELDLSMVEKGLVDVGTFVDIDSGKIPSQEGLLVVKEDTRLLYTSSNDNLRVSADAIVHGPAVAAMSSDFWHPDLRQLHLAILAGRSLNGTSMQRWHLKLVADRHPIFNWPVLNVA